MMNYECGVMSYELEVNSEQFKIKSPGHKAMNHKNRQH